MPASLPGSDADFALARRAVARGWLTVEQVESAILERENCPATRLLDILPLTPDQVRELQIPARTPPEVAEAMRDPAKKAGRYRLVNHLKSGGMGSVWRAWDEDLGRWVALKLLKQAEDEQARAYFRREAQLAAQLDHPNIAKIYEVGDREGDPYIAMQYVDGETLGEAKGKLSLEEKLRSVRWAAAGVKEAHARNIIHRDLKPANVMIERPTSHVLRPTSEEERGRRPVRDVARPPGRTTRSSVRTGRTLDVGHVYVMDFGLAKETRIEGQTLTMSGAVVGTPHYMAPEQARGKATAQSDVYGLGAILYELATGRPPFTGQTTTHVLTQVLEDEPVWPRRLDPGLPADVEAIILKALEKEPRRRYADADQLIADLDAYLAREPLRYARRPTLFYVLGKKIRRQPLLWAFGVACVLALLGGAAFGGYTLVERNRALRLQAEADRTAKREADRRARSEEAARKETERLRGEAEEKVAALYLRKARDAADRGDFGAAALFFAQSNRVRPRSLAAVNARTYARLAPRPLWTLPLAVPAGKAAFSPDGGRFVTVHEDGVVREWRTATARPTGWEIRHPSGDAVPSGIPGVDFRAVDASYHPDGKTLATARGETIRFWSLRDGWESGEPLVHPPYLDEFHFNSDGSRLLSVSPSGVWIWDLATRKVARRFAVKSATAGLFLHDGKTIVTTDAVENCVWWDAQSGRVLGSVKTSGTLVSGLALSPTGADLAAFGKGDFMLFDARTRSRLGRSRRHGATVLSASYSIDGTFLATGGLDGVAYLWRPRWGLERATPIRHEARRVAVAVSPQGDRVILAGGSTVRCWSPGREYAESDLFFYDEKPVAVRLSPAGNRLAAVSGKGRVVFGDPETGRRIGDPLLLRGRPVYASFNHDGRRFVVVTEGSGAGDLWLLDSMSGVPIGNGPVEREVLLSGFDANHLCIPRPDGTLVVRSIRDGSKLFEVRAHDGPIRVLSPFRDGMISAGDDGRIRLWRFGASRSPEWTLRLDEPVVSVVHHESPVRILARGKRGRVRLWNDPASPPEDLGLFAHNGGEHLGFAGAGRWVYLRTGEDRLHIWSGESGKPVGAPRERVADVRAGAAKAIVVRSKDPAVGKLLVDLATGRAIRRLADSNTPAELDLFTSDGRLLVGQDRVDSLRVWDARSGTPRSRSMIHPTFLQSLALSTDGRTIFTGTGDQRVRLWELAGGEPIGEPLPQAPKSPVLWLHPCRVRVPPDGRRIVSHSLHAYARLWDVSFLTDREDPEVLLRRVQARTGLGLGPGEEIILHKTAAGVGDLGGSRPDGERARELLEMTRYYLATRFWEEAVEAATEALRNKPDDPTILYERGRAYRKGGLPQRAILDLNRAIERNPEPADPFYERGLARLAMTERARAEADFTESIDRDGRHAGAYRERGKLRNFRMRPDLAIADLSKSLEIEPKDPLAWIERGLSYWVTRKHSLALRDMTEAIRLNAKGFLAYSWRARIYADLGRYSEAVEDYRRAIRNCNDAGVRSTLEMWLQTAIDKQRRSRE